ncbi:MAG: hypothetical protein IJK41_05750 [Muribaculaceae bacterium]|nr:hypothetical protein [Muribaculaceae bacterium]
MIVAIALAMMAMIAGCGRTPRYDGRLVAADSLMRSAPDSALAIVEGIDRDSLAAEGDRAYHDLLLTQARYRCYITATSDSNINRALAYYRSHPKEREKLTRAYIYKGTVMEELGHPDSAMFYYKHAEATAAPTDHFNLGYINLRIADLFLDEYSEDSTVVLRLHRAIGYFEALHDTTLLIHALGNLGKMIGYSHPDSAKCYLWRAIKLSRQYDSTLQYTHESTLAGVYMFQEDYNQAKTLAMDVLRYGSEYSYETQFYYYAAMSFIRMGQLDSAKYVMRVMPAPEDEVDSLTYYNLIAEISKFEGKADTCVENVSHSKDLLGDILYYSRAKELLKIESDFDTQRQKSYTAAVLQRNRWVILGAGMLLILVSLLAYWLWHRYKTICQEQGAMTKELEQAMAQLEDMKNNAVDTSASGLVGLSAIQELYDSIRMRVDDNNRKRKVITLSSLLKSMYERREILELKLNDSFWEKMRSSIDSEYKGIITFVKNHYPALTKRELDYFCLLCSGLSPQLIMLCMNVTNAKTVTNYRSQLMKKLGLDMTFDEFIENYTAGRLN